MSIPESTENYSISNGFDTIEFRQLEEGWKSTIKLPFHKNDKENGQVAIFDDGEVYDRYLCKFTVVLDATNMALMNEVYNNGSQFSFQLLTPPNISKGFAPFTPAYGGEGAFFFEVLDFKQTGALDGEKYQWFRCEFNVASAVMKPSYSPSLGNDEGNLQIGTIGGLRYPIGGYKPTVAYDVGGIDMANDENFVNTMGWQNQKVRMTLNLLFDKMSLLIKHLLSERTGDISILVPSGHYPYGASQGDNQAFVSRLISDTLVVRHMGALRYEIDLEFQRVS